jgi:tripartite-type tricarboxylate transporter receptor subunit TctC
MLGGHVDLMFPGLPVVEPLLKSGQLKALAVVSKRRLALLPGVPTLAEAGVPDAARHHENDPHTLAST